MTSTILSPKQLNFAQISIVCVDILKQCLIDILDIHIKPKDLSKEIHLSHSLKGGKDKLNSAQRDLCCFSSLGVPDYSKFDVTLLYRLIRHLCPTLKPSKDWGKEPNTTDLTIGDDIERIRLFRNKHYAHAESAKIPDNEFTDLWNEGKSLIHRIQIFTTANGYTTDYGLMLTKISGRMIKYEEYTSYVSLFRAISIEKDVEVICGDTAHFKADIRLEESAFLSVSWEKVDGSARKHIDISCEKYKGSTSRQLFIYSACKEDEGGYQAVISKNIDHKIFSNVGFLKTQGELPLLDNLKVSTTKEEICIHYSHTVPENSPRSNDIKWTKNKTPLDLTNKKYCGGNLDNSVLKITCPTKEDRGEYSCTVSNAVGSVSREVTLDEPSAKISTKTPVIHGSETKFSCLISSCPFPEQIEWQKSCDGNTFHRVDINELKYHGSYEDPSSPVLCLPKTTFDDQQFYRIAVRNKIGECMSNTHFLEVVGERPIIINATCTTKDRSVRLNCDVLLYDKSPALQDVYWTKNEQKLDIQGSGGKYSGVSTDYPSLTISNVNKHDAGNYQLTAINSVGPTKSDVIVLGVPGVVLERTNKYEDGSHCFMVTIKSNPAPFFVKWSMKDKESETLQQINVNADEYKGTSTSFPNPMLVVKNPETLENYCFQIEAKNVIGYTEKVIPDETNPVVWISDDNTVENLNRIYERGSRNIMFGKVFDELAEKFPEAKIGRLKDLIQNSCGEVEDVTSLQQANSARDCFRILKSENIFTPEDVIFVQYLLKMTECEELETKCIEYAKRQNARYYYEKPPDNGYKNVHFHVVANIGCYRTENITKVRETVAAIVGCTFEKVLVNGYLHSASFILVLSIKNNFVYKLLALERKDKDKLSKLSIDYFKIDSTIIRLKGLRENDEHTTVYPYLQGSGELSEKPCFSDNDLMDETNPILLKSDDNTVNVGNLNWNDERRDRTIRLEPSDFNKLAGQFLGTKISRVEDRIQGKSMPPGRGDDKIPRNEMHSGEELEIERQIEVRLLQERINKGSRPLNVALIGPSGSGTSSFCNSVLAAFSFEGWRERATTGGHGMHVTHHLMSFPRIEYLDFDALYDYNYPTLIDMNGFEDSCDILTQELLRIVFFGRLPNEERLMDAVKLYNSKGLDGLKEKYSQSNEYLKVDRVIFIASANNFPLPTRLMEAVRNTARKENRVIPIFGVLTHEDKISRDDSDYMRLEQEFIEGLGIPENRFLLCTTYCDAYDKHHGKSRLDQRHSAIDIPILKFMQLVCDQATRVIRDKQTYTGEEPPKELNTNTPKKPSPEPKPQPIPALLDNQRLGRMWVKGVIIAVIFFLLLPLISYERAIQRICVRHGTGVSSYCGDQSMVGRLFASFVFAAIVVVLDIVFDRYNQLLF